MAAEALILEDAYQRGYTDAVVDMRKKKRQRQQREQAEPLVIETPEAATEGSIRVYDYDGCCIYAYFGKIRINNDGKDGKDIDVEAIGYLEGYQEHKEESGAGE